MGKANVILVVVRGVLAGAPPRLDSTLVWADGFGAGWDKGVEYGRELGLADAIKAYTEAGLIRVDTLKDGRGC